MSNSINMVISDNGDGSNSIQWVTDPRVLEKMEELADVGDAEYASGDGLQVKTLYFDEGFDILNWAAINGLIITSYSDVDRDPY